MQKRKCSSSCVVSPFVELHCHQYKSLCTDCQPHNFTFPRAARNFVEKHGLFSRSVCRNRAFYTKEGSPFCPFPAAKRRVLQGVMPNVHTFSSFSPFPPFFEILTLDIRQTIPYNAPKTRQGGRNMRCILKNAKVFSQGVFHLADVFLSDGKIVSIGNGVSRSDDTITIDISMQVLFLS